MAIRGVYTFMSLSGPVPIAAAGSWTALSPSGNLFLRGAATIDITDDASTEYTLDASRSQATGSGTVQFRVYDIGAAAAVITGAVNQYTAIQAGPLGITATDKRWRFEYQGTAALILYGIIFSGKLTGAQM